MGELIDNIKNASNGKPYVGTGTASQTSNSSTNQTIGKPMTLKHSLDSQSLLSKPMVLQENTNIDE